MAREIIAQEVSDSLNTTPGHHRTNLNIDEEYAQIEVYLLPGAEVPTMTDTIENIGEILEMDEPEYSIDISNSGDKYTFTVQDSAYGRRAVTTTREL